MSSNRRNFLKTAATGVAGLTFGGSTLGMSAKSYSRIIGANERINLAFMGCGRRVGAYYNAVQKSEYNTRLLYICDVMKSQREKVASDLKRSATKDALLINDFREILASKEVDVIFNATPDHWHAPGSWMAMEAGKHVYLEKPFSHNPHENELLLKAQRKYGKIIQIGTQQRSSLETREAIAKIHSGSIGEVYEARAFYTNNRGRVVTPVPAPTPDGLDWDLWQGPAPHEPYRHNTWDYNWHWYGWKWGTAETGNNATHELDVARWALRVNYPKTVGVVADKRHFHDDGWEMYDTMEASYQFEGNKQIIWDGKSRNGYPTYGSGRGTIIHGTEGSIYIDRDGYKQFNRDGKLTHNSKTAGSEAGTALGGGGDMTDTHIQNLFDTIRGKTSQLNSPLDDGHYSQMLVHYANIAYRTGNVLEVDNSSGRIYDREAMKLWSREYESGWEPNI